MFLNTTLNYELLLLFLLIIVIIIIISDDVKWRETIFVQLLCPQKCKNILVLICMLRGCRCAALSTASSVVKPAAKVMPTFLKYYKLGTFLVVGLWLCQSGAYLLNVFASGKTIVILRAGSTACNSKGWMRWRTTSSYVFKPFLVVKVCAHKSVHLLLSPSPSDLLQVFSSTESQ